MLKTTVFSEKIRKMWKEVDGKLKAVWGNLINGLKRCIGGGKEAKWFSRNKCTHDLVSLGFFCLSNLFG